ncbi:MAG: cob(I)yrinic acid a,c-diamide adenosyltransferase [Nitrospinaceae bacterium]
MIRINKVYTKGGDKGETSLVGGGRVPKDHPRVEAFGAIDELNSILGLVRIFWLQTPSSDRRDRFDRILMVLQNWLFDLGSELATDPEFVRKKGESLSVEQNYVTWLEQVIDAMNEELESLPSFVLPGGGPVSGFLHQARTVCRRAERRMVALNRDQALGPWAVPFINRVADALFVFSRWTAKTLEEKETLWQPEMAPLADWKWS